MSDADKHKRILEHEHQSRTLQVAGEIEGRVSRADERAFADEADANRRAKAAAERAAYEAELVRRVKVALAAVGQVRELLAPDRRSTARAIDDYCRRLRGLLTSELGTADNIDCRPQLDSPR